MRILKIIIMICRSCISEDTNWPCIASLSFPRQLSKHSADGEITMSASLNHATWFVSKNSWNILVGFIVNHFGRLRIRFLYKFICSESVWSNFIRALKHSTKTHATPRRCQTKPTSCQNSVNLMQNLSLGGLRKNQCLYYRFLLDIFHFLYRLMIWSHPLLKPLCSFWGKVSSVPSRSPPWWSIFAEWLTSWS